MEAAGTVLLVHQLPARIWAKGAEVAGRRLLRQVAWAVRVDLGAEVEVEVEVEHRWEEQVEQVEEDRRGYGPTINAPTSITALS